jgi:hypothetical protein
VSWTFRGGMDLRDEVAGTHGTIWMNHFLRTGFEMFTAGGGRLRGREAETSAGWLFPVGDEVCRARLRGHVHRHVRRARRGPGAAETSTTDTSSTRSWTPATGRPERAWDPVELRVAGGVTPRIAASRPRPTRATSSSSASAARRSPEADPQGRRRAATSSTGSSPA